MLLATEIFSEDHRQQSEALLFVPSLPHAVQCLAPAVEELIMQLFCRSPFGFLPPECHRKSAHKRSLV